MRLSAIRMIEHGKIRKMKKIIPALAVAVPLANNTSSRKYGPEENKNAAGKGRNMTTNNDENDDEEIQRNRQE